MYHFVISKLKKKIYRADYTEETLSSTYHLSQNLTFVIRGYPSHGIMHCRYDGYGLPGDVHAGKVMRGLFDTRQLLHDMFFGQVVQLQMHVVLLRTTTFSLHNFQRDASGNYVSGREILEIGGVLLHETFSTGVNYEAALTSRSFRDEHSYSVNSLEKIRGFGIL